LNTCKALDGSTVTEGKTMTLVLAKGSEATNDYSERTVRGKVHAYEHVDRVLDDDGYAVDRLVTLVWEVATDDATIGFRPENVRSAKG
jgi:hypothetical protein